MGITIGGVPYDAYLKRRSLTITNALNSQPDTADFELIAGSPVPAVGSDVIITDGATTIFGGVIVSRPEKAKGHGLNIGCSDYRIRADRKVMNDHFVNMTAGEIIVAIFAKYAPDFDTSGVDLGGTVIASIRFNRKAYITTVLQRLADLTGYIWDIDYEKNVIWSPPGTVPAAFDLNDSSFNFSNLVYDVHREQLRNWIIVKGGKQPATNATVDYFTGDNLNLNFRLSKTPYSLDQYIVFQEDFSGAIDTSKWVETDITNGSPPAGHIGSDGYIMTTIQDGSSLAYSGLLQVVGGNSVWGSVRLQSADPVGRGDGYRRFEFDVFITDATTDGIVGLWDPSAQTTQAGCVYGVYFDSGTVRPYENGANKTPANSVTYVNNDQIRIRITPKSAGGAMYHVNKDAANGFRPSQWVLLYDSAYSSLANLTVTPIYNYNFKGRIDRVRVFNRLYNVSLTVAGASKVVGLLNIDEDSGCDAMIGVSSTDVPVLAFFADSKPAAAAQIVCTYYEGIPVVVQVKDQDSIDALASVESNDGVYQAELDEPTLNTRALCQLRGTQELELYANPETSITFKTTVAGLKAGQSLPVTLTSDISGHTIDDSFLIQTVVTKSLGNDEYEYSVTAGSKLKGLEHYIYDLIVKGKATEVVSDENSPVDELIWGTGEIAMNGSGSVWSPQISASEVTVIDGSGSVEESYLPPYRLGPLTYTVDTQSDWNAGTHERSSADAGGNLLIPSPTFTRATVAYRPDNGASVSSGAVRYPSYSGLAGAMVEEGTTNLVALTNGRSSTTGVNVGLVTPTSVVQASTNPFGSEHWLVTIPAGSNVNNAISDAVYTASVTWAASTTYTVTIWVCTSTPSEFKFQVNGTSNLGNMTATGRSIVSGGDTWLEYSFTGARGGTSGSERVYVFRASGSPNTTSISVKVGAIQHEQKVYKTTMHPLSGGTRNAERLQLPYFPLASAGAGTVIIQAYWSGDKIQASPARNYELLQHFNSGPVNGIRIVQAVSTPRILLRVYSPAGSVFDATWNSPSIAEGWHWLVGRWSSARMSLLFDSVEKAALTSPTVPTALPSSTLDVGNGGGAGQWNDPIALVAYYSTSLSDSEIATEQANGCANAEYRLDLNASTLIPRTEAIHTSAWIDSGANGALDFGQAWESVVASETVPANTTITRRFRCQNDLGGTGLTSYSSDITTVRGRYVQVETTLTTSVGATASPSVASMTIDALCLKYGFFTYE